jgi:DNA-binding Xre family transcriptional regulator
LKTLRDAKGRAKRSKPSNTPAQRKAALPKTRSSLHTPDVVPQGASLGEAVRDARGVSGKSLRELAAEVGMTPSMLSKIENGSRKDLRLSTAVRLCRAVGLSLDQLTGLTSQVADRRLARAIKALQEISRDG